MLLKLLTLALSLAAAPPARTATFTPLTYGWLPLKHVAGPRKLEKKAIKDARLYATLKVAEDRRTVNLQISGFIYGDGGTVYTRYIDRVAYTAPKGFIVKAHAQGHRPLMPETGAILSKIKRSGSAMHLGAGLISSARARTATEGIALHVGFQKVKFTSVRVELVPEAS